MYVTSYKTIDLKNGFCQKDYHNKHMVGAAIFLIKSEGLKHPLPCPSFPFITMEINQKLLFGLEELMELKEEERGMGEEVQSLSTLKLLCPLTCRLLKKGEP